MINNTHIISNVPVTQNFLPEPILEDHYVLGDQKLQAAVLMKDGHGWGKYMPTPEDQNKNGLETNCCPAYGTHNAIEAIGKLKYGSSFQSDLADRYLGIMSGMKGFGGYPHVIAETIRNGAGCVPEVFLPFDKTIDTLKKYFSPNPMSYELFKYGWSWNKKYDFGHQWVFQFGVTGIDKKALMKEALKFSPVGVAGYAWSLHNDMKYYNDGSPIHWFVVFDYVEGDHWLAYDSYAPHIKKLDWNYDFAYAKSYTLNKRLGANTENAPIESAVIPYLKYLFNKIFNR